ncbi:MAG: hypothetical protein U0989_02570 [Azonexus sp.]|nr:hypothetical protein [Azonexus sp.]MDZ4313650.1 hypothetical protein [Azonexus sp.]
MLEPCVKQSIEMLEQAFISSHDAVETRMKVLKQTIRASLTRQSHGLAMARLLEELDRTDCKAADIGLSRRKLAAGEQLPSFDDMAQLLSVGIDVTYVLCGSRLCDMEALAWRAGEREGNLAPDESMAELDAALRHVVAGYRLSDLKKQPAANEFTLTFMAFGGTHYKHGETRRLAFCNWLLVERLEEYSRRNEFIKAFSAGGDTQSRWREAANLSAYSKITMGDLAEAVYGACILPEVFSDHAGEDGCK